MAETKDIILARMLGNVSGTYDKTEGSFIYDIESPLAIELESLSTKTDTVLNYGFVDTATGEYLDKKVSEHGIIRKAATKSIGTVTITGVAGSAIVSGELVASDNVNFIFTKDYVVPEPGTIDVEVICEIPGTIGNVPVGAIKTFPKTLEGLQTVTNANVFANGYDEEADDDLRARFYTKVQTPVTSGNKYHYKNWALEVTGVGDAKILPLWNGNGTVKIILINSNKRAADSTLINSVSEYIEENRPIGATVTVESATELAINISLTLSIDENNYTLTQVKSIIEANLTDYLADIAFTATYISYAKIGNIIINSKGVLDYSNLKINSGTSNINIPDNQVAVLGGVTIG